ncbi:MAG: hypothetical protein WD335_00240 [Candidatus Paceibacterota bacterium]
METLLDAIENINTEIKEALKHKNYKSESNEFLEKWLMTQKSYNIFAHNFKLFSKNPEKIPFHGTVENIFKNSWEASKKYWKESEESAAVIEFKIFGIAQNAAILINQHTSGD